MTGRTAPSVESALWAGVLAVIDGLPKETPGVGRTAGEFAQDDAISTMRATCTIKQLDGSSKVYALTISAEESRDEADWFWGPGSDVDKADSRRRVVVEGEHYLIGDEKGRREFRGFGGRRIGVEFFDGRRVTTTNLWHQGVIPPKWRERYPDNARFVDPEAAS